MLKKRKLFLFALLGVLLALFIALPSLATTALVKNLILKKIESKFSAQLSIGDIGLSWFGPQKVSRLSFKNENLELKLQYYSADINLFDFVSNLGLKPYELISSPYEMEIKGADVNLSYPDLPFAEFKELNASIKRLDNGLDVMVSGKTEEDGVQGSFSLAGKLLHSPQKYDGNLKLEHFPVTIVDRFLSLSYHFGENLFLNFLGKFINLSSNFSLSNSEGQVTIDADASNLSLAANFQILNDSIVLNEPLIATLKFSNGLTNLIGNQMPLEGLNSLKPAIIRISDKGFFLPRPFNLAKLKIPSATLDPSLVQISNEKLLNSLAELLKQRKSSVDIWFSPIAFSLDNGILNLSRFDFLIDYNLHLGFFGKANLLNLQLDADLILTADALYVLYGVSSVPEDFAITVPVGGSFEHLKVDTKSAAGKVGTLLAAEVVQGQGGVWGNVLGGIAKQTVHGDKVPPAQRPFPWENTVHYTPMKKSQKGKNPLFDIFK